MSTIKSSSENLTLNADGANNDIKFQSNGSEVAQIDQAGVISSTGGSTHADNVKDKFGTGNDLEIFHDGTHSYIKDVGTGDLRLMGTNLSLRSESTNEPYLNATENGAVDLFHNNVKKFETTATGVTVTGAIGGATNLGKILQVVSYILDDSSAISTASSSYVSTSITLNITPAATSSKVLILFNVGESYASPDWALYRGSSSVSSLGGANLQNNTSRPITSNYIDSPSSTSAVTYTIYFRSTTGSSPSAYLKNNSANTVSLIAMEIGA